MSGPVFSKSREAAPAGEDLDTGFCGWCAYGFIISGRFQEMRKTEACAESYVNQSERTERNLKAPGVRVHVCACACVLG